MPGVPATILMSVSVAFPQPSFKAGGHGQDARFFLGGGGGGYICLYLSFSQKLNNGDEAQTIINKIISTQVNKNR